MRQPLPVQVKFTDNGNAFSAPAIGNLGGNGTPQVVIMTQGWQKDQRTGADCVVAQVSSFDGRTGEPIWKHQLKWMNDSLFEPRVLLADIEGNGKVEVYASIAKRSDGNGSRPAHAAHPEDGILLDAQGQVRPALERPIAGTFELDGKEAFLLLGNHKLTVTRGGVKNIVWERSDVEYVREVLPAKQGQPPTVVVPSGTSLLGLDGATGKPLWRCPIRDAESILPARDPREPPWLISHADGSTICRRALATTADGEYAPAVGTPCKDALAADDPRLVRPLPWVGHPSINSFAPWIGCIIYLLPLLVCTVRRRWRSVAAWLVVFLVATVVIAVVFLWDDAQYVDPLEHYGVSGWYQVMYYGMIAAGAIVVPWFIVRLVWLLGRRGVRRILARTRAA